MALLYGHVHNIAWAQQNIDIFKIIIFLITDGSDTNVNMFIKPGASAASTKRGGLPKHATQIMKSWLFQHIVVGTVYKQCKYYCMCACMELVLVLKLFWVER